MKKGKDLVIGNPEGFRHVAGVNIEGSMLEYLVDDEVVELEEPANKLQQAWQEFTDLMDSSSKDVAKVVQSHAKDFKDIIIAERKAVLMGDLQMDDAVDDAMKILPDSEGKKKNEISNERKAFAANIKQTYISLHSGQKRLLNIRSAIEATTDTIKQMMPKSRGVVYGFDKGEIKNRFKKNLAARLTRNISKTQIRRTERSLQRMKRKLHNLERTVDNLEGLDLENIKLIDHGKAKKVAPPEDFENDVEMLKGWIARDEQILIRSKLNHKYIGNEMHRFAEADLKKEYGVKKGRDVPIRHEDMPKKKKISSARTRLPTKMDSIKSGGRGSRGV